MKDLLTPKEEAKEIVDFFMNFEPVKLSDYSKVYLPTAKYFARMVANRSLRHAVNHGFIAQIAHFEEVLTEIDNLYSDEQQNQLPLWGGEGGY